MATAAFDVTATLTLTPDEGPSGITVEILGDGFTPEPATPVKVWFDLNGDTVCDLDEVLIAEIDTGVGGSFTDSFIVPTTDDKGEYNVYALDETYGPISAVFDVTGTTWIGLTPVSGKAGSSVTIEGLNFTAQLGTEVTVAFGTPYPEYKTFLTNSTGGIKGTFTVPSLPVDIYPVTATDENELTATADFQIAITLIFLSPGIGPTGMAVNVISLGFTELGTANVYFDSLLVLEGIPTNTPAIFYVPTVPMGTYTVTYEDSEGLTASESFEVDTTTKLVLKTNNAPVGYVVDIEGYYFTAQDVPGSVDVVLYDETGIKHSQAFATDVDGYFVGTFTVPDIDLGQYFINATDAYLFPGSLKLIKVHEVPFSVVEPYREIRTLLTEYDPSDIVSFYIKSTFDFDLEIIIKDPNDYPFKTISCPMVDGPWVEMDDWWVVPYAEASFNLPSDATPGLWNYTAYDVTTPDEPEMADTGLFTVSGEAPPEPPEYPAEITGVETRDSTGAIPKTNFVSGETAYVYADVTNLGAGSQPMIIVVQLKDPNYRTMSPNCGIYTLIPGQTFGNAPSFVLDLTGYTAGTWTAKVMVLDTWPALGGVPIGIPVTISFTVN